MQLEKICFSRTKNYDSKHIVFAPMTKNCSLLVLFCWPQSQDPGSEHQAEEVVFVDENKINVRVFGPSREIYVRTYKNQRLLEEI